VTLFTSLYDIGIWDCSPGCQAGYPTNIKKIADNNIRKIEKKQQFINEGDVVD